MCIRDRSLRNVNQKCWTSKFCELCPNHCVLAEPSGTYPVLSNGETPNKTYKDLISKTICANPTDNVTSMNVKSVWAVMIWNIVLKTLLSWTVLKMWHLNNGCKSIIVLFHTIKSREFFCFSDYLSFYKIHLSLLNNLFSLSETP